MQYYEYVIKNIVCSICDLWTVFGYVKVTTWDIRLECHGNRELLSQITVFLLAFWFRLAWGRLNVTLKCLQPWWKVRNTCLFTTRVRVLYLKFPLGSWHGQQFPFPCLVLSSVLYGPFCFTSKGPHIHTVR